MYELQLSLKFRSRTFDNLQEEIQLENLDKVHLIGHSLGAHLLGYAGYSLQRDFGLMVDRITALDRLYLLANCFIFN